jgi:hypothetical protein
MRKIGLMAFLAAMLIAMPAMPADKPVYSMWSPTYRGMTQEEFQASAQELQREQSEARERYLIYSMIGLVCVGAVLFLRRRRG